MAIKKPLCNYGGDLKELQSGDTVEGASTSYASTAEVSGTHTTGSITSGTAALTVASGSGIADGDAVVGEGITPGTTVSNGGGTTSITLSANANATLSSDPVSFYTTTKSLSPGNAAGMLCRAWVNFNGTGTVAIRASYNVSSITDRGTGDYTVNFTTAMPDANYAVTGAGQYDVAGSTDGNSPQFGIARDNPQPSVSAVRTRWIDRGAGISVIDPTICCIAIFQIGRASCRERV